MTHFTFPSTSQSGRSGTPHFDKNAPYLFWTIAQAEGHYITEAWPKECRARTSFQFYHLGNFDPPIVIQELDFATPEEAQEFWQANRFYYGRSLQNMRAPNRYCTPVMNRDATIERELAALDWADGNGVRRVRKGKRYLVYLQFYRTSCDHWFVVHNHAAMIVILDHRDNVVRRSVYECDQIWQAVQDYKFVLENFDLAAMEFHL